MAENQSRESALAAIRADVIAVLQTEQENTDKESAHGRADTAICGLLRALGYGDVVDEWEKVPKWYA